jgi:hypothetical protein
MTKPSQEGLVRKVLSNYVSGSFGKMKAILALIVVALLVGASFFEVKLENFKISVRH